MTGGRSFEDLGDRTVRGEGWPAGTKPVEFKRAGARVPGALVTGPKRTGLPANGKPRERGLAGEWRATEIQELQGGKRGAMVSASDQAGLGSERPLADERERVLVSRHEEQQEGDQQDQ